MSAASPKSEPNTNSSRPSQHHSKLLTPSSRFQTHAVSVSSPCQCLRPHCCVASSSSSRHRTCILARVSQHPSCPPSPKQRLSELYISSQRKELHLLQTRTELFASYKSEPAHEHRYAKHDASSRKKPCGRECLPPHSVAQTDADRSDCRLHHTRLKSMQQSRSGRIAQ